MVHLRLRQIGAASQPQLDSPLMLASTGSQVMFALCRSTPSSITIYSHVVPQISLFDICNQPVSRREPYEPRDLSCQRLNYFSMPQIYSIIRHKLPISALLHALSHTQSLEQQEVLTNLRPHVAFRSS